MPLGNNRVLGDASKPAEARPHRVALAGWPTMVKEPRTATLEALLNHIQSAGYEGVEMAPGTFARYLPDDSPTVIARKVRRELEKRGLQCFGATTHATDEAMRKLNWIDPYIEQMQAIREMGGQFVGYQIFLHPDYFNTGGDYRQDERYLQWCAQRVTEARDATWELGLNFYLEVHVDRITEDPQACCRILEMATCELNGDLSHLLARGITKGKSVEKMLKLMGHTHVRMARQYGDLSAVVENPRADWDAKGATWQLFQLMRGGLAGGLSSRTIAGETGPMHLVKDTLTQDASLVPLYRAMARYADASAQGIALKVEDPGDLKPWG
jgi:sugar phosphate isomerase/epimerase